MIEEVIIEGDIVYIVNQEDLDPNGDPVMIEMSLDEYNQLLEELDIT